jgi:hypothetical protein
VTGLGRAGARGSGPSNHSKSIPWRHRGAAEATDKSAEMTSPSLSIILELISIANGKILEYIIPDLVAWFRFQGVAQAVGGRSR